MTLAEMSSDELKAFIEQAKLSDLLSNLERGTPPDEWLPGFFDTFGSFEGMIKRD